MSSLALELGLSEKELFGFVVNGRFVVHKLPEHVVRVFNAFGCGERRLRAMYNSRVAFALIFFHPDKFSTKCFKVFLKDWLDGVPWVNKLSNGLIERQRLVLIEDCELL